MLTQEKRNWILQQKAHKIGKMYSIAEKEFLSIVKSLNHFEKIILACKIIILTDNKNIMDYRKIKSNRISKWS